MTRRIQSFSLLWIILTTCVIFAITINRLNYRDNFACGGRLGVGYPVSFLCDYGGEAGSPMDSWGKVDLADFPYFSLQGLFVDGLVYVVMLFMIERLLRLIVHYDQKFHSEYKRWMIFLSVSFLLGYLVASFILLSNQVNFHDYILGTSPAVIYSPTPIVLTP